MPLPGGSPGWPFLSVPLEEQRGSDWICLQFRDCGAALPVIISGASNGTRAGWAPMRGWEASAAPAYCVVSRLRWAATSCLRLPLWEPDAGRRVPERCGILTTLPEPAARRSNWLHRRNLPLRCAAGQSANDNSGPSTVQPTLQLWVDLKPQVPAPAVARASAASVPQTVVPFGPVNPSTEPSTCCAISRRPLHIGALDRFYTNGRAGQLTARPGRRRRWWLPRHAPASSIRVSDPENGTGIE